MSYESIIQESSQNAFLLVEPKVVPHLSLLRLVLILKFTMRDKEHDLLLRI